MTRAGEAGYLDDSFSMVCMAIALVVIAIETIAFIVLVCCARWTWKVPHTSATSMRLHMSGGMASVRRAQALLCLTTLAGCATIGLNLLNGTFSIVVGLTVLVVSLFIGGTMQWMSCPKAVLELDSQIGTMR